MITDTYLFTIQF